MSLIRGIHHVSLKCCDRQEYEKVLHFYHEILGLEIIRSWPAGTMLDTGNGIVEIFTDGEDHPGQGAVRHFALATDDVDGCVSRIRQEGYEIFVEPKEIAIPSKPAFPARIAFCRGPLGEEIEFFQER